MQTPDPLFCPIRRCWVSPLPEEVVRQYWIQHLVHTLLYPLSGLAVEKELRHMPHLSLTKQKLPVRRADIVCFSTGIHPDHPLYPLLLIECKAVPLTSKVIRQVIGYNLYVQAPFIAVVNQKEACLGWHDTSTQAFQFISSIPSYSELLQQVQVCR